MSRCQGHVLRVHHHIYFPTKQRVDDFHDFSCTFDSLHVRVISSAISSSKICCEERILLVMAWSFLEVSNKISIRTLFHWRHRLCSDVTSTICFESLLERSSENYLYHKLPFCPRPCVTRLFCETPRLRQFHQWISEDRQIGRHTNISIWGILKCLFWSKVSTLIILFTLKRSQKEFTILTKSAKLEIKSCEVQKCTGTTFLPCTFLPNSICAVFGTVWLGCV